MIREIGRVLAPRADVLEAAIGLALIITGVAMWSLPAALIVAGGVLLAFAVWPLLGRRG